MESWFYTIPATQASGKKEIKTVQKVSFDLFNTEVFIPQYLITCLKILPLEAKTQCVLQISAVFSFRKICKTPCSISVLHVNLACLNFTKNESELNCKSFCEIFSNTTNKSVFINTRQRLLQCPKYS